jgi:DNA-binding NtrC family response regulator
MKYRILIIDDHNDFTHKIRSGLESKGYHSEIASDGESALKLLDEKKFHLVISEIKIPHIDGLEILSNVKSTYPETAFIVMTACGSIETAVNAMKMGACDYITKPFHFDEMLLLVKNIFEKQNLANEIRHLRNEVQTRYSFGNIIGKNRRMQEVYQLISDVAETDATVLIRGETGTGKELVAKSIHFNSRRKNKVFVSLNCGALPETLLESELFGYEKGAFTGAMRQKIGKFEYADGGTVFLDEVGDLSPTTQIKLLRVLQERVIERVGGNDEIHVDVRIIAATHKDLEDEVENGRFREDLYYRLNVVPIWLPPLRERKEDILLLTKHFLSKCSQLLRKEITIISQEVINEMMSYDWPGNVRQLENLIERAIIMAKGNAITHIDLPDNKKIKKADSSYAVLAEFHPFKKSKERLIKDYEREYFVNLLRKYKGNITQTSKISQVDIKTIRRKMEEYGLRKEDFKFME